MDGPTIYAPLFDVARQQPQRAIEEHLTKQARASAREIAGLVDEAYRSGLRDGFQQGVQHAIDQQGEQRPR